MDRVTVRAAFIDRDGTLNERPPEHEYVTAAEDFVWLPGAREAVTSLARHGFIVAVVSNQRGVARGLVSLETIRQIEQRIQHDLAATGARITAFRYCFHDLGEGCECRKPGSGLLHELAAEFGVDLRQSWMIGDDESDVLAGVGAGTRTALVDRTRRGVLADVVADSLLEATRAIVATTYEPAPPASAPTSAANSSTSAW
jgi:histidinol-phosphate phosphatase family protein